MSAAEKSPVNGRQKPTCSLMQYFQNRTDGALVRLTTPIYPGEVESDADKRLQGFIREFTPILDQYLPSAPQRQATPAIDRLSTKHS